MIKSQITPKALQQLKTQSQGYLQRINSNSPLLSQWHPPLQWLRCGGAYRQLTRPLLLPPWLLSLVSPVWFAYPIPYLMGTSLEAPGGVVNLYLQSTRQVIDRRRMLQVLQSPSAQGPGLRDVLVRNQNLQNQRLQNRNLKTDARRTLSQQAQRLIIAYPHQPSFTTATTRLFSSLYASRYASRHSAPVAKTAFYINNTNPGNHPLHTEHTANTVLTRLTTLLTPGPNAGNTSQDTIHNTTRLFSSLYASRYASRHSAPVAKTAFYINNTNPGNHPLHTEHTANTVLTRLTTLLTPGPNAGNTSQDTTHNTTRLFSSLYASRYASQYSTPLAKTAFYINNTNPGNHPLRAEHTANTALTRLTTLLAFGLNADNTHKGRTGNIWQYLHLGAPVVPPVAPDNAVIKLIGQDHQRHNGIPAAALFFSQRQISKQQHQPIQDQRQTVIDKASATINRPVSHKLFNLSGKKVTNIFKDSRHSAAITLATVMAPVKHLYADHLYAENHRAKDAATIDAATIKGSPWQQTPIAKGNTRHTEDRQRSHRHRAVVSQWINTLSRHDKNEKTITVQAQTQQKTIEHLDQNLQQLKGDQKQAFHVLRDKLNTLQNHLSRHLSQHLSQQQQQPRAAIFTRRPPSFSGPI